MTKPTRELKWRLLVVMAERNIRTVSELQRRLRDVGLTISTAQLGRIVSERPARMNTDLLDALVTVLACDVGDLLQISASAEGEETRSAVTPLKRDKNTPKITRPHRRAKPTGNITGPKVSPFPIAKRK